MEDDRSITAAALARLLARLDPDAERAPLEFERLRRALIRFFDWRGAWPPDECADETLDRLARNPVDGGSIIWAIKQHGIKVMTPAQSYAREDDNIILMYIEFGMAQKYVDDLSANVKRGLHAKAEMGWLPGRLRSRPNITPQK
jgi:hypothetical protein